MIFPLIRRQRGNRRLVQRLHGEIVAAARRPEFYAAYGVADTFEGRFELLALHAALVLRRLRGQPAPGPDLAQDLVDCVFTHLDGALREIGIGDLSVPKRMKKLAEAFYGRIAAYDAALAGPADGRLEAALARNVFAESDGGAKRCLGASRLAAYARAAAAVIERTGIEDFAAGRLSLPDPATI